MIFDDADAWGLAALASELSRAAEQGGIGFVLALSEPEQPVIVSSLVTRWLGRSSDEVLAGSLAELEAPEAGDALRASLARCAAGEPTPGRVETQLLRADGQRLAVEITVCPVRLAGRAGTAMWILDASDRAAWQAKMVQADRLAAMGTLAAGVAHEINNPLAYVLLHVETLRRELPRLTSERALLPAVLDRLHEISHGIERVAAIVRDLRRLTRADEDVRGPCDLASIIDAAVRMASHELQGRARLVRSYDDVGPVLGNPARLEQVFLNLLLNAAQAFPAARERDHRVEILLTEDGAEVVAEVRDNGSGIPAEALARVFEPFFTTKPVGQGTGLGLAVSHGIVTSLGGTITVASVPSQGTSVTVRLPRALSSEVESSSRRLSMVVPCIPLVGQGDAPADEPDLAEGG